MVVSRPACAVTSSKLGTATVGAPTTNASGAVASCPLIRAWTAKDPSSANHCEETGAKEAEVEPCPGTMGCQAMASTAPPPPFTWTSWKVTFTFVEVGSGFRSVARNRNGDPCPTDVVPMGRSLMPTRAAPAWAESGTSVSETSAATAISRPVGDLHPRAVLLASTRVESPAGTVTAHPTGGCGERLGGQTNASPPASRHSDGPRPHQPLGGERAHDLGDGPG